MVHNRQADLAETTHKRAERTEPDFPLCHLSSRLRDLRMPDILWLFSHPPTPRMSL